MAPDIHSLGHVALETPDLDGSLAFFRDVVGLEPVAEADGTVYLRAVDEFAHHSLCLTEADAAGVDHIGWQTSDAESVGRFADQLEAAGVDVSWVAAGVERGQGQAIRFRTPTGHRFELFYGMETPDPPADRRSRLKNRPYASPGTNPIAPRRIDHVQVWDGAASELADWLEAQLGFRVQEYYDAADGSRWGTFLSANGIKIEIAVVQDDDPTSSPSVNHVAYTVDRGDDLFAAADALNEHGIPTDGFGQHSISRAKFLYARDPASGHRIEFSAGGYLVFDPSWEPIAWREGDLPDRQWIGGLDTHETVPYVDSRPEGQP